MGFVCRPCSAALTFSLLLLRAETTSSVSPGFPGVGVPTPQESASEEGEDLELLHGDFLRVYSRKPFDPGLIAIGVDR